MTNQQNLEDKRKFPFRNASIEELGLALRTKHLLMRNQVLTVYDLVMCLSTKKAINQIGEKTYDEIKGKLVAWVREHENGKSIPPDTSSTDSDNELSLLESDGSILEQLAAQHLSQFPFENESVKVLGLSSRARNVLKWREISTLYDLVLKHKSLEDIHFAGDKIRTEIKSKFDTWVRKKFLKFGGRRHAAIIATVRRVTVFLFSTTNILSFLLLEKILGVRTLH